MGEERCSKIEFHEHITAYLEGKELIRDVESIDCDRSLMENVVSNYIIVKKMLSYLPWQDQILCKSVCKMWRDAVQALQRENLRPVDFIYEIIWDVDSGKLRSSGRFTKEPMLILMFANFGGFCKMGNCNQMFPRPCKPTCYNVHWLMDSLDHELCYPKDCNFIVRACYLSYMPVPSTPSAAHILHQDSITTSLPFICGVFIPKIADVQYHALNIKGNSNLKTEFFDVVQKISETRVFKGLLVFVTDKYLLNSLEDLAFLNFLKEVQPIIPFAFGGCIVEDAMYERKDLTFFMNNINNERMNKLMNISENVVTIAMFTVPKAQCSVPGNSNNFEMFSLIVESFEWSKPKIVNAIQEFANNIPDYEHSVVIKLSCVGRDERHDFEQQTFRASFPNTPLLGCYGNGELGFNHPARPAPTTMTVKRKKKLLTDVTFMYSYSTVFVYIGWGKIVKPAKNNL